MSRWERIWLILDRVAVVALLAASTTVIWKLNTSSAVVEPIGRVVDAAPLASNASPVEAIDETLAPDVVALSAVIGASAAKLAVVEFSDYQCPFCAEYSKTLYADLKKEFIDTGRVRYVVMNFPLPSHPNAVEAATAAECTRAQGKLWQMRAAMFDNQQALTRTDLIRYATEIGADSAAFDSCVGRQLTKNAVERQRAEGKRLGINATPSFLIGRVESDGKIRVASRIVGARSTEVFRSAINAVGSRTHVH